MLIRRSVIAAAVVAAALSTDAVRGQQAPAANAEYLRKGYDAYRSMMQSSPYRSIPWQFLGPTNFSGRATDIAVADRNGTRRVYVAFATSGVWKTDDHGTTWQPMACDANQLRGV